MAATSWSRAVKPRKWALSGSKTAVACLFIVATLFPLVWMGLSGFKAKNEVTRTPFRFLPEVWLWENYLQVLQDPAFVRAMAFTLLASTLFALGSLVVNSMAAYVFARLEFPFKRAIWAVVISTMFIPSMTILLTSFLVVNELRMVNTIWVLVLPGMASASQIFFIRQFYLGIPTAIEEAALIDGAGPFRVFAHVFVPMSKGIFVVSGMTMFLAMWNSYVWPVLTITESDLTVIQQFLALFRGARSTEYGLLMAGSTLALIPVLIIFFAFQRQIVQGARLSGFK
ncbi:MAG: carbohydrate ABC transporter permease [Bifidobacteriaceae bacterium]|jgi:multiple sugar transport system permease protein|nr:carbohydrate ABC transporter permease [Bifidobacteriaceae bacterium]